MFFHKPQEKPALWGPKWAVQSAVRHTFEDVWGILAPVLYLPFIEGAGKAVQDYSRFNRIGQFVGTDQSWDGKNVRFAGTNNSTDRIDLGSVTSSDPLSGAPSGEVSLLYRFRPGPSEDFNNGYPRIFDKSNGANMANGWGPWFYSSSGTTKFYVDGTLAANIGSIHTLGGWGSYGWTVKSGELIAYKNGEQFDSASNSVTFPSVTTNAAIGNWNHDDDRNFAGLFDQLIVFDKILTADQVALLHEQPYRPVASRSFPSYFFFGVAGGGETAEGTVSITAGGNISITGKSIRTGTAQVSAPTNIFVTGKKSCVGDLSVTAGGAASLVSTGSHNGGIQNSAAVSLSLAGKSARIGSATVSTAGAITPTGKTTRYGQATISGGGTVTVGSSTDNHATGTVQITAGAGVNVSGEKSVSGSLTVTTGGQIAVTGSKVKSGIVGVTGAGQVISVGKKQGAGVAVVTGSGGLSMAGIRASTGVTQISGAPSVTISHKTARAEDIVVTASGVIIVVGGAEAPGDVVDQVELAGEFQVSIPINGTFDTQIHLLGVI